MLFTVMGPREGSAATAHGMLLNHTETLRIRNLLKSIDDLISKENWTLWTECDAWTKSVSNLTLTCAKYNGKVCNAKGTCLSNGGCACDCRSGYKGTACEIECPVGPYGGVCAGHGDCNAEGNCLCRKC